jgi:hypothetical protein
MHTKNAEALLKYIDEAFPALQRSALTPEQIDELFRRCEFTHQNNE